MKAIVQFRGREIAHTDLGKKLLLRFAQDWQASAQLKATRVWRAVTSRDHQPSENERRAQRKAREAEGTESRSDTRAAGVKLAGSLRLGRKGRLSFVFT